MEINVMLYSQIIFIIALAIGAVSYYLGRKKTKQPMLTGVLGFFLGLIPILGLIYLIVLVRKPELAASTAEA
ncbi:hypothetical protein [Aliidiomarina indica]|uniref:hypothetical protein n=1 Tax=Aliidiomarina indica TaxID=2749147 RepID=UPI00188DEC33|nr:hypothetical protein [Aliidiomarina indica]